MAKMLMIILLVFIAVPLAGGLLNGLDRKLTARLQGRVGPPVLQPFYDVLKLWQKNTTEVNHGSRYYLYMTLFFVVFTTGIMLSGGNILLAVFILTLAAIFFVLSGYAARSPYSFIGAERELLQMMAYEPMLLLTGIGLYYASGTFFIAEIINTSQPAVLTIPGVLGGLLYILTFKLRKSPFDLSMSHHGHQEIVKGVSTEYTGKDLAILELIHWYETIIALAFVFIFFVYDSILSYFVAAGACVLVYILEIIVDNGVARTKWEFALTSSWIVTGVLGIGNLLLLSYLR
ncbi:MAG TPA: NADH-quinone oxidoreductase subunit H [Candidatus Avacidaminococcus intestinavium]|uniref:NADH-quinone oxidoreductase subunit H n=1 Tax=Candidatus Avacidaminococcus intestinavium TaxID=2840684 RepID=A0A9D1SLM0_9FIRM|nr:NADH-quinone oxidoreductase subunit H [Candidatus Avacidaminococcus intestinavium]